MTDEGLVLKSGATKEGADNSSHRSLNEGNFDLVRDGLQELVERIEMTREHVSALTPAVSESYKIFSATSELRSIVDSTEQATQHILRSAEAIQDLLEQAVLSDRIDIDLSQRLGEQVTLIITSCSFQDLTGQRISATVNTLEHTKMNFVGSWSCGTSKLKEQPRHQTSEINLGTPGTTNTFYTGHKTKEKILARGHRLHSQEKIRTSEEKAPFSRVCFFETLSLYTPV